MINICSMCHDEFSDGQRIVASIQDTFIFKPADVKDTVNAATATPEELLESRKEYKRTAIAKVFATFGREPLPAASFNVRHDYCDVKRTGGAQSGTHPVTKHSIRFSRSLTKRASR